jgi:predicted unusual protein kinase regulating ubiquinone biosynthesis (AarF/ABC1/UbiB family)
MLHELNYQNEAYNTRRIAHNMQSIPGVHLARIYSRQTTSKVMTEEFIHGVKLTTVDQIDAAGIDRKQLARAFIRAMMKQVLVDGFFHADPHPGNILVQRRDDGEPRLVLLDFGLAKDLPPRFREGVLAFAAALVQGRSGEMAQALVDLGFETRRGGPEALDAIAAFMLDAAVQLRQRGFLDRNFAAELGRELSERVRANPIVRMPSHLVLVGRVLGLLSGVNRTLESRIDLMATILPYVMGSPRRPAARGD